jgi:DNA-binding transcriptional LysR family regulator
MFEPLFAENGLSLERLRALLEIGVAGSIVRAADGDPVKQSQYSRQIKELEDFFRTKLCERHGRGTRLTVSGRELARISRFFMLGLSNFRRGGVLEEQTFRIGTGATFLQQFLISVIANMRKAAPKYVTETLSDRDVERRLHDLTLDFGIVTTAELSRPLQTRKLGEWKLELWSPKTLYASETSALRAFKNQAMPLVLAKKELESLSALSLDNEGCLDCDNFVEAQAALGTNQFATLLPDFLAPIAISKSLIRVRIPTIDSLAFHFYLAWNPRLLRLNPHAAGLRDRLAETLTRRMANRPREKKLSTAYARAN